MSDNLFETRRCPYCNERIFTFFFTLEGKCPKCQKQLPEMDITSSIELLRSSTSKQSKPLGKWEIVNPFATGKLGDIYPIARYRRFDKKRIKTIPPEPKPLSSSVSGCEVTGMDKEFFCIYERGEIDNSESPAEVEKTISVSQRWSRICVIEKEKTETMGLKLNIFYLFANLEGEAKKVIRDHFSFTEETELITKQEVKVIAPAREKVQYTIIAMLMWRLGNIKCIVKFDNNSTRETKVPFKLASGISFDVKTIGLNHKHARSKTK